MGRSTLCNALGRWARRRQTQVRVVFDGPQPPPGLARQIGNSAIEVSYSGGASADAVLIRTLAEDSAARRMLVVSSDREISRAAGSRRARAMRSDEFWALVQHDLSRPAPRNVEPEEKRTGIGTKATEEWLREFGFDPADREPSTGGADWPVTPKR
jgi:predicted RNA-binding protein with PIN domain